MNDEYDFSKMKRRPGKVLVIPDAGKIPISLRLDANVLVALKDEAERLGMPYQTLLGSIVHRYMTGELIDKKEIEKITK